jgi:hypothetical protein
MLRATRATGLSGRLLAAGAALAVLLGLGGLAADERATRPYLTLLAVAAGCALALRGRAVKLRVLPAALRREPAAGAACVLLAVVALALAVARLPQIIADGASGIARARPSLAQADIEPMSHYGSTAALAAALRVIPADASYSVLAGDQYPVPYMFKFWLAPRRFGWSIAAGSWVIVYQTPVPAALRARRALPLAAGVEALAPAR